MNEWKPPQEWMKASAVAKLAQKFSTNQKRNKEKQTNKPTPREIVLDAPFKTASNENKNLPFCF